MTGCDCPLAGYCERHGVNKTPHLLHLCRTNDRYYDSWEEGRGIGQKAAKAGREFRAIRRQPPPLCVHRGAEIGKADCGCSGSPKVYECSVHTYAMEHKLKPGKVTFVTKDGKQASDMGYCFACENFEGSQVAFPAIETRNLIYHIYPHGDWLDAMSEIAQYREAFNGQVVVAIAFDPGMDLMGVQSQVKDILQPGRIIVAENDSRLREAATFKPLIESVLNNSATEATFYAHSKGNTTADGFGGAVKWRRVMVANLLGRLGDAMGHLTRHPFVGTHKLIWPADQAAPFPTQLAPAYSWMHAGTFWWFRHDQVAAKYSPDLIADDRYGAEAFPAQMFPHEMAYSMWQPWAESESAWPQHNPYDQVLYDTDYSQ
jgi:hypothetical protein